MSVYREIIEFGFLRVFFIFSCKATLLFFNQSKSNEI
jgi:hypothetical protein